MRRALKFIAAAVVLLILVGVIYEKVGEIMDPLASAPIGRRVDIGGRSLNIACAGSGDPAVIFDSGASQPGYGWGPIASQIAGFTRACWFDRAGFGWSDEGPFPRTAVAVSHDLHELLHRADIPAPYVLVGHSSGGLNARVFTGLYRNEVAGLVLVDAAHEDEPRRAPPMMLGKTAPRWAWHPIWILGHVAKTIGLLRLMAPKVDLPVDESQRKPEQVVAALRAQPKSIATLFDASGPESYAEAEKTGTFGDLPLIVLTRGKIEIKPHPSEIDRQFAAYTQVWMHEIQPKLAALSTMVEQIIVPNSGHDIPHDAPDVIVDAVTKMIFRIRSASPRPEKQPQKSSLDSAKNESSKGP
jgi:pimeloyl-ACP methyl ester carboxylesterase